MKRTLLALALAAGCTVPAFAEQSGGIAGRVFELGTGQPVATGTVAIYRLPFHKSDLAVRTVAIDKGGNFADITLEPGRYLVTADVNGAKASCAIDDVFGGQTTRLKIYSGSDGERCVGPRVHAAVINPANVADEYVIR